MAHVAQKLTRLPSAFGPFLVVAAVMGATPKDITNLRDRDRFLIGRSFRKQLEADCMG